MANIISLHSGGSAWAKRMLEGGAGAGLEGRAVVVGVGVVMVVVGLVLVVS